MGSRKPKWRLALVGAAAAIPLSLYLPTPAASAQRTCAYFEFTKSTNNNSTLRGWNLDQFGRCIITSSWRAGSGLNTNACDKENGDGIGGWLPNGWSDVSQMSHGWTGTLIKGRVWRLEDKACSDGTLRTELFIHTEETSTQTQVCTPPANDSPWCWDNYPGGAGTNDYFSVGCIKVRRNSPEGPSWPNDLGAAHQFWHDFGGQHVARTDSVWVHQ